MGGFPFGLIAPNLHHDACKPIRQSAGQNFLPLAIGQILATRTSGFSVSIKRTCVTYAGPLVGRDAPIRETFSNKEEKV